MDGWDEKVQIHSMSLLIHLCNFFILRQFSLSISIRGTARPLINSKNRPKINQNAKNLPTNELKGCHDNCNRNRPQKDNNSMYNIYTMYMYHTKALYTNINYIYTQSLLAHTY